MTTLYLDWGGDLQVSQSGGLINVDGAQEVVQRIVRRILTAARRVYVDGTASQSEYIFDPNYGIGARAMVGGDVNRALITQLQQMVTQGVLQDSSVNSNIAPTVSVTSPNPNQLTIVTTLSLLSGQQLTIKTELP